MLVGRSKSRCFNKATAYFCCSPGASMFAKNMAANKHHQTSVETIHSSLLLFAIGSFIWVLALIKYEICRKSRNPNFRQSRSGSLWVCPGPTIYTCLSQTNTINISHCHPNTSNYDPSLNYHLCSYHWLQPMNHILWPIILILLLPSSLLGRWFTGHWLVCWFIADVENFRVRVILYKECCPRMALG